MKGDRGVEGAGWLGEEMPAGGLGDMVARVKMALVPDTPEGAEGRTARP